MRSNHFGFTVFDLGRLIGVILPSLFCLFSIKCQNFDFRNLLLVVTLLVVSKP